MATIKYLIQSKSTSAPIYLRLSINRDKSYKRKTGLFINSKDWSKATGLPKQNNSYNKQLNIDLGKLENKIIENINVASKKGIRITGDWLIYNINKHFNRIEENVESNLLVDHIQKIIDNADTKVLQGGKVGLSKNRIKGYITFKGIIEKYQKHIKKEIDFKEIDINFEDGFRNWLIKKQGYSINYAGKNFDNLKAVCNDAKRKGKVVNDHADHLQSFTEGKDERDIVTLSFDELDIIANLNDLSTSFENVRKWLLLGCEIGQRGGDLLNITKKNFVMREGINYIDVIQQKTGKTVTIPLTDKTEKIIKSGLPYEISIQKFNDYLKKLCELAEINEPVKGRLYVSEKKRKIKGVYPKYKLITSHTCRRSFATNYYKQIPTPIWMEVTGHSKESLFLTYIGKKKDKDENANLFLKFAEIVEEQRAEKKDEEKRNRKSKMKVIKKAN